MSCRAYLSPLFTWRSGIADATLPGPVKCTAYALSLHMSERGDSCFPSVATLARESGFAERTVRAALRQLEQGGWLVREERRGRSSLYRSAVPAEVAVPPPRQEVPPTPAGGAPPPRQEVPPSASVESDTESDSSSVRAEARTGNGRHKTNGWDRSTAARVIRAVCYPHDGHPPMDPATNRRFDIGRDLAWWRGRLDAGETPERIEAALRGVRAVRRPLKHGKYSPAKVFSKRGDWLNLYEQAVTAAGKMGDRDRRGAVRIGELLQEARQ